MSAKESTVLHDAEVAGRAPIDRALMEMLESGEVTLACQPIDPAGGRDFGRWVELLLRPRLNGTRIRTDAFIDRAAELSAARPLDLLVLRAGLKWLGESPDVALCSINVSGQSISQPQFLDEFMRVLGRSGVDPGRVCIEITETAPIDDFQVARQFAGVVRREGCRLALDDFGGGASNMMLLVPLEMDYLKIDGRFIRHMPYRADHFNLVRGIAAFAEAIGLQTVAEGVEAAAHENALRGMGVDYLQGYYREGEPRIIESNPGSTPARGRAGIHSMVARQFQGFGDTGD